MHSVIPQQTVSDQNIYVMLLFVLIVHSIVTYLLFKFESFIEQIFGIQDSECSQPARQETQYSSLMKTDRLFS